MSRVMLIALLAAAACGHPATAPQPTGPVRVTPPSPDAAPVTPLPLDQDLARLAERGTQLFADWAKVLATSAGNCATATAGIQTLIHTYADVIAANANVLHDGRAKELKAALAAHDDAMNASAKSIADSPTMSACAQDRAFADALDALVAPP